MKAQVTSHERAPGALGVTGESPVDQWGAQGVHEMPIEAADVDEGRQRVVRDFVRLSTHHLLDPSPCPGPSVEVGGLRAPLPAGTGARSVEAHSTLIRKNRERPVHRSVVRALGEP